MIFVLFLFPITDKRAPLESWPTGDRPCTWSITTNPRTSKIPHRPRCPTLPTSDVSSCALSHTPPKRCFDPLPPFERSAVRLSLESRARETESRAHPYWRSLHGLLSGGCMHAHSVCYFRHLVKMPPLCLGGDGIFCRCCCCVACFLLSLLCNARVGMCCLFLLLVLLPQTVHNFSTKFLFGIQTNVLLGSLSLSKRQWRERRTAQRLTNTARCNARTRPQTVAGMAPKVWCWG